jgi:hypothetical protein
MGWVVQYVSRVANEAAYHLDQLAFMHGEGREWRSDFRYGLKKLYPMIMMFKLVFGLN